MVRMQTGIAAFADALFDPVQAAAFVRSRPLRKVPKCRAGQKGLDQEGDGAAVRPRSNDTRTLERFLVVRSECWGAVGARQVDVHLASLDGAPEAVPQFAMTIGRHSDARKGITPPHQGSSL